MIPCLSFAKPSQHCYEAEEALTREIARQQTEKLRNEKLRERVRKESHELRELESKLREAHVAREQLAQIAEKRALAYDQMVEEAKIGQLLIDSMGDEKSMLIEEECARKKEQEQLGNELKQQLVEQRRAREAAYQDFLRDKQMIEDVVKRIQEEDKREMERQLKLKETTKQIMEEHRAKQQAYRQTQLDELRREELAMKAYVEKKDAEKQASIEEKKDRLQAVEKLQERLGSELLQREALKRELEEVRQTLLLEEEAARYREDENRAQEVKLLNQQRLQNDYEQQIRRKHEQQRIEKLEEERIRQMMQHQFQVDEQQEKIEEEKRRQKQQEHALALRQLLLDKRARLEADLVQAKQEMEKQAKEAYEERRIEAEERERLLRKHAPNLVGYLPRGVFRSKDELEAILRSASEQPK